MNNLSNRLRDAAQALTDKDWKLISIADLRGLSTLLTKAAAELDRLSTPTQNSEPVAWELRSSYDGDEIEREFFESLAMAEQERDESGGVVIPLFDHPPASVASRSGCCD